MWIYDISTYVKDAISRIERIYACLFKFSTPLPTTDCHPETDTSPILKFNDHMTYQMLLGILQWIMNIGRLELSQLVASLNRFGACPSEDYSDLTVRAFGYDKITLHKVIEIDSRPMKLKRSSPNFPKLIIVF